MKRPQIDALWPRLRPTRQSALTLAAALAIGVFIGWQGIGGGVTRGRLLRGVETVTIVEGPISFEARVDSGAAISSVNAREVVVPDGDPDNPRRNVGRQAHFTLANARGETAALSGEIVDVKSVRTGDCREWRYHVYLTVEVRHRRTRLLMNLNDRSALGEKMLIGRDWLRQGYVVDVSR